MADSPQKSVQMQRVMPMKIEILQEKENKPLARKEIDFRVEHIGSTTPSRADVKAKIVAQFDADAASVVIRSLDTKFGAGMTEGSARIYTDPEQMKRVELGHILKRDEAKKAGE
jgi:ribosomal protein S24E